MGLRSVGAWAERAGWGTLTEGALRYRFRRCEAFVFELIAHSLSKWLRVERSGGLPLRMMCAMMVALPGPSGRSFRLHATYDPALGVMTGVELTDDSQGESASRAPLGVRDVLIADRGYGRAKELVARSFRVVFWLVRVYLPSVPLWNKRGGHLDSRELIRACARGSRDRARGRTSLRRTLRSSTTKHRAAAVRGRGKGAGPSPQASEQEGREGRPAIRVDGGLRDAAHDHRCRDSEHRVGDELVSRSVAN